MFLGGIHNIGCVLEILDEPSFRSICNNSVPDEYLIFVLLSVVPILTKIRVSAQFFEFFSKISKISKIFLSKI